MIFLLRTTGLVALIYVTVLLHAQQINLFDVKRPHTILNTTQERMGIEWQSGGGENNVQTGKKGSFELEPSKSATIITSGLDCIDYIVVTSKSNSSRTEQKGVCQQSIRIEYEGDARNQKLILK